MLQAHLVRVEFLYDVERCRSTVIKIKKSFNAWARTGMHGKCSMAIVVVSNETTVELMKRIEPTLREETCVVNWWFEPAPHYVMARHGFIDPLSSHVRDAWEEIRQRRHSKNMGHSQWRKRFVERSVNNRERGAVSQVPVERGRMGQGSKKSDYP